MAIQVNLNQAEHLFLSRMITVSLSNPAYWEIVKKMMTGLVESHATQSKLVTEKTATMAENILYKIVVVEADQCIQDILSGKLKGTATKPNIKRSVRKNLTKILSYDQFLTEKADSVDANALKCINNNPNITRRQLSETLSIRLSTICGSVNRLYKQNYIRVSGVTVDPDSNRKVETLQVRS